MKHKLILLFFLLLPVLGFCQQGSGEVKKVAILEVVDKDGNISSGIKLLLRGSLAEAVSHTPGYEAYDRNNLDKIMQEENMQSSGLMDEATIQRLGRKVGASYILVVEAAYMGAEHGSLAVLANMTNVETARITTVQSFGPVEDLDKICNDLTYKLFGIRVVSDNTNSTSPAYNNDSYSYNSRQQTGTHRNGDVYNPDGIEMVYVEGTGTGILATKSFYIGKYEVTQAQWKAVMGNNPSEITDDNNPVESVSWNDVQQFIKKLNSMTGRTYSLPTEAQWEYAARGGKSKETYEYAGSNTLGDVAWYGDNSGRRTHQVGTKSPNSLGIYDMSGNVWEWCSDCYNGDCSYRVLRGGGWIGIATNCRVSYRFNYGPGDRHFSLGFRLVLVP